MFNSRLDEALFHVTQGFHVVSVWSTLADGTCKCQLGVTCTSPGKHPAPPKGFLAASGNPDVVRTMLSAASEPNYGLVWPEGERIVVMIDVDGPDWHERLDTLKAKYGPLPPTKTTRTPSGGLHLFYDWPKGVPVPQTNHLHGFVARFPMKGYVVGPGSVIGNRRYTSVGPEEIAELPLAWAEPGIEKPSGVVLTVAAGYELPDRVPSGHRHDEITRMVASLWNKNLSKAMVRGAVYSGLVPLFDERPPDTKIDRDIDEAWDTAVRKWGAPRSGTGGGTGLEPGGTVEVDGTVIDPLSIESRIERPSPIDLAGVLPTGLALLLEHFRPLTDAPWSSLALASCVTMSALAGTAPSLGWRGRHRAVLFGVLVGESNYGRKGATMREVEGAFRQVDPLLDEITVSGIASGEVLVDILNESKANTLGTSLIWEHEIANLLVIAAREGNIMSGNIRKAWDGDSVQSRSRAKGKSVATGYNVAFMGGVTPAELSKRLTANDIANGWANRFLWFHSEKRPEKYDPRADHAMDARSLLYLRDCITFARGLGLSMLIRPQFTMSLTDAALERMEAMAERLDVPPVGAIGALRQRMPSHVIRLAMVAALFDQTREVDESHVEFGERMTDYAIDSMRSVFGIRVDDPVAMLILSVLGQVPDGWMNTTDLKKITGKEYSRTMSALSVLLVEGLVVREQRPTAGRPAIGYRLTMRL